MSLAVSLPSKLGAWMKNSGTMLEEKGHTGMVWCGAGIVHLWNTVNYSL